MVVALIGGVIYLAVGFAAGLHFESGPFGVVVLFVLALLIALAFASLGAFIGLRTGLRRGGPGRVPAVLRVPVPVLELAAARADRARLVPDDRHLEPGLVPVRGPAVADHLRLAGAGAGARVRVRGGDRADRRRRARRAPCGRGWRGHEALLRRGAGRRLPLDQEGRDEPAAAAAVADLPAVLLRRVRGRAVERRQRAGLRLPVGLHGVPVRVRAAAGVGVRRRVHGVRDRLRLRERLLAAADAGGAEPARDPGRLHARRDGPGGHGRRAAVRRRARERDAGRRQRRGPVRTDRARAAGQLHGGDVGRRASRCGCARSRPGRRCRCRCSSSCSSRRCTCRWTCSRAGSRRSRTSTR